MNDLLDKQRTIARPGFNRWLVPPAALALHICIGMAYGFSVFWLPLSQALGADTPLSCQSELSFWQEMFTTECNWRLSTLNWIYALFFMLLGGAAALFGGWVERVGPRKASFLSAILWCGGLLVSAIGIQLHQFWLLLLGSSVIGGIGLGLGYIAPVSTLMRWFPDKRGMANGMAVMGFGGGALVGSPLADMLMRHFSADGGAGVWQTFVCLALVYSIFMLSAAFGFRTPAPGWQPAGWTPPAQGSKGNRYVPVQTAWRTRQFWLFWTMICMNICAGIGLIGMASPMLQEAFGGHLLSLELSFENLNVEQLASIAAIGAGFTGLISLFNIGGRFFWGSLSDKLGRKPTYMIFFALGLALFIALPRTMNSGNVPLFVVAFCIIVTLYGGGFAIMGAFLADLFGTRSVSAIQGRLLTAWSVAGIIGPMLVNYLRESQIAQGVTRAQAYNQTLTILAVLLAVGLVCILLIRPLDQSLFVQESVPAVPQGAMPATNKVAEGSAGSTSFALLALPWLAVGLPIVWGMFIALQKALILFS